MYESALIFFSSNEGSRSLSALGGWRRTHLGGGGIRTCRKLSASHIILLQIRQSAQWAVNKMMLRDFMIARRSLRISTIVLQKAADQIKYSTVSIFSPLISRKLYVRVSMQKRISPCLAFVHRQNDHTAPHSMRQIKI